MTSILLALLLTQAPVERTAGSTSASQISSIVVSDAPTLRTAGIIGGFCAPQSGAASMACHGIPVSSISSPGAGGSIVFSSTRRYVRANTAASDGSSAGFGVTPVANSVYVVEDPVYVSYIRTGPTITNTRMSGGFANNIFISSSDPAVGSFSTTGIHFAGLARGSNGASWLCCSATSAPNNATCVDTGVAVAASTEYKLVAWVTSTSVRCAVNDSSPVSVSTNLIAATNGLGTQTVVVTKDAVTKNVDISAYGYEAR